MKLLAMAASARSGSVNGKLLARTVSLLRSGGAEVVTLDYADYIPPAYDDGLYERDGMPKEAQAFVELLQQADGLVLASPEYNWSYPGSLKNLIDWVSRERPSPLEGKTGLLLAASPALHGGMKGLLHLRVPLEVLGMYVNPYMFALGDAEKLLAGDAALPAALQERLEGTVRGYLHLTRKLAA